MKILYLGINYWPEETGIGPVTTARCEHLAARGHDVTVCTGLPYYPAWKVTASYRGKAWSRELHNGVNILRSYLWIPARVTTATRVLHEASFLASSLVRALGTDRPHILVIVSPPLGLGLSAWFLSRWWNIPYIFDVMDLQPDAAADLGMLRSSRVIRILYRLEVMSYRNAALVTTLTEGMRRRIVEKGIPREKVRLVPVAADPDLFETNPQTDGTRFRRSHGLEGRFLVVHSGNMGVKQGLDIVLSAAERTRHDDGIAYLLVGDGAVRELLQQRCAQQGLDNVCFLPLQDRENLHDMLAATDVGLVTQQKTVSDIVFPSKTVTLLASGCPVIGSMNAGSYVAQVLAVSGAAVVVPPEDPDALAAAVTRLRGDPARLAAMRAAGKRFAGRTWHRDSIYAVLEQCLNAAARHHSLDSPPPAVPAEYSAKITGNIER